MIYGVVQVVVVLVCTKALKAPKRNGGAKVMDRWMLMAKVGAAGGRMRTKNLFGC
jgi:hypothetical protein